MARAKSSRRKFLAAVPALAVAAPAVAAEGQGAPAVQKKTYRKLTPTSMTVKGQQLYSPELSFGNLVFVSGKGAGVKATGDIAAQTIERALELDPADATNQRIREQAVAAVQERSALEDHPAGEDTHRPW